MSDKTPKKTLKVNFVKGSDKRNKNGVEFPKGRRCEPRYMVHLKFLYKLVFNPPTMRIQNEYCLDVNQYQVFTPFYILNADPCGRRI